jgi:hypothetical protein
MKRKSVLGKMVILGIVAAFAALTLATTALAQDAKVLKESSKMMSDGWKMFEEGQSTVIKGLEMNNQIAVQMGFQELMKPGNKTMGSGRDSVFTGAKLFAQGQKVIMENPDTPTVLKEGVDMLRNGFKIAIGGKETMEKGMAMNNELAKSKGALDKFAQGNEIMKTGMATMAEGIKLFMKGEKLYLGAK